MRMDKMKLWIASHLPGWLIYWCGIVLWAHAMSTEKYQNVEVSRITAVAVLNAWEDK